MPCSQGSRDLGQIRLAAYTGAFLWLTSCFHITARQSQVASVDFWNYSPIGFDLCYFLVPQKFV